ncbi:hypothetical protein [Microbacterium sp. A93]|uniref:hypothetical protein n=1 Tax=Microbacterium sp. A93 TaxID=3450716 RepID=UPI003F4262A0
MRNGTIQDGTMPEAIEDPTPNPSSKFLAGEQARWEAERTVWQHPHEQTLYGQSLVEAYETEHPDGEVTVIDMMLSLDQYRQASQGFEEHLIGIVQSRAMQLAPDRVEPVEAEALLKLPKRTQLRVFDKLSMLAEQVFVWLQAQGKDPIPGASSLPPLVTEADRTSAEQG